MNNKPFRCCAGVFPIILFATLVACTPLDVRIVNAPIKVETGTVVEPFLFSDRLQVKTNNPYDDFQAVVAVPEDKIIIVEHVSASVFGDVQDNEEFVLTVSGSAKSARGTFRPRHFVTKLQRVDRVTREGNSTTSHMGGGEIKTYAMASKPPVFYSSINISVTSNLAVGSYQSEPRKLYADVQLSGRLVDATQ